MIGQVPSPDHPSEEHRVGSMLRIAIAGGVAGLYLSH